MNVLGIGEVVLDRTCVLDAYPNEGSKLKSVEMVHSVGGPVAAALILLSNLGVKSTFVTSYGDDEAGECIELMLNDFNIDVVNTKLSRTKVNTVLLNGSNGSRTIIKDHLQHQAMKISSELIRSVDLFLFDRTEPEVLKTCYKQRKAGAPIIYDPSTEVSPVTLEMFSYVDYLILPIEAVEKMSGKNLTEKLELLAKQYRKPIIMTAGEKGSYIVDDGISHIPSYRVKAVDTLGAGDVFRGAFGYAVVKGKTVKEAVVYANLVAALQCTKVGNGTAVPTQKEIAEAQRTLQETDEAFDLLPVYTQRYDHTIHATTA